ncbi:MAG: PAS domain-containing protein [Mariniblastus sp.]|nr:PAS domain-containing protein [Mariniblastus sp.]
MTEPRETGPIKRKQAPSNESNFWLNQDIAKVLDHANELICYVDEQLVYRYFNQPFADFWNLSRTEHLGSPIENGSDAVDSPVSRADALQALQGSVVQREQQVNIEGRTRYLQNKYQPDMDAAGSVNGFFLYSQEVTNLKERSNNLLRILDNVTACLFWVDQQLIIKFAGQGGLKHFGFDAEQITGMSIEEFIGTDAYQVAEPYLRQALAGHANQYENLTRTADGRQLEIQVHCVPDVNQNGDVQGLFVVSFDITSIKLAQRELERAKQRLDMAVRASQIGIWETDPEQPDWFFTDHIEQLWGLKAGSLDNSIRKFDSRIHPQDYPKILEIRRLTEEEKTDHTVQFRALTNTGYRWMQAATHSQFDDRGNLLRRTGTIAEIDQIKLAEIKSADEVEQRDLFMAMLSHELRNPMTAIYHAIYYAQETGDLPDSLTEIFEIIDRQSRQMTGLMDDLLEVSRFNQEKADIRIESIDLNRILAELVPEFAKQSDLMNQGIVLHPAAGSFWVVADPERLNQAIRDLLENANHYHDDKARIEIALCRDDEKVICTIATGRDGNLSELQPEIIKQLIPEEQENYRSMGGLTIDLFLARCIIRELGGKLIIQNDGLGKGCTFTFWLPASRPSDAPTHPDEVES